MFKYSDKLPNGLELISDSMVKKTGRYSLIESVNQTRRVVKHFIKHPDPLVVPIYEWLEGDWYSDRRVTTGWFTYSYTMKRMCVLSDDERRIISHCILLFRNNRSLTDTLDWIDAGRKDYPSLVSFMEEIISQKRYVDLHNGNVLKDELGDYKLIDVEGFLWYPHDTRDLSWISKEDDNETT